MDTLEGSKLHVTQSFVVESQAYTQSMSVQIIINATYMTQCWNPANIYHAFIAGRLLKLKSTATAIIGFKSLKPEKQVKAGSWKMFAPWSRVDPMGKNGMYAAARYSLARSELKMIRKSLLFPTLVLWRLKIRESRRERIMVGKLMRPMAFQSRTQS